MEVAPGTHGQLVTAMNIPTIRAERQDFSKKVEYYFQKRNGHIVELTDCSLHWSVSQALESVPRSFVNTTGKIDYWPGYYEFYLTRDDPKGDLFPVFIDYRGSLIYQQFSYNLVNLE